jgi:type VI secretion system protein ImpH
MAAPDLRVENDVQETLLELLRNEPFKVRFFEAVRLLRLLLPERKPVGQFVPPGTEAVRFIANPGLEFPASEVQALEWSDNPDLPVKMMVNFMGLCAPNGVLPPPYTELIIDRAKRKNNGFRDFLDIFNHRLISLFYRAWEKYHFFVGYEREDPDGLTPLLLSIVGLGTEGLLKRQVVADQALAYYAGLLGPHPRSAQALKQILEDYFQVPIEIEQFVGRWVRLPVHDQTRFEDTESIHVQLGKGAVTGDEIWDQQSTVRVKLGPLSLAQYCDFLPTPQGTAYTALKSLLKFYANDQIDFQVQLVLKQEETPSLQLTGDADGNVLLGWVTWIKNAPMGRDPGETILEM